MERNLPDNPTEQQLIETTVERLTALLPPRWEIRDAGGQQDLFADAMLRITAPDGRAATIAVETKTLVSTRDVPIVAKRASAAPGAPLLCARYLSPRTREALAAEGISYSDLTGNMRIVLEEPGLFVMTVGADADPYRSPDRPTNSLRGAPAAKVVRALVDISPPWTMRDLAKEAGTSLASTSRTVEFLDREALVERDSRQSVVRVDWEGLLRRWADDYELGQRRRVLRCVAGRGLGAVEDRLRGSELEYVISGSMAAQRLAPYAEAKVGLIYARRATEVLAAVGAREVATGANLLVVEPLNRTSDDAMFIRPRLEGGLQFAGTSQVVVDLLAGPGRNPAEGEELLRWMAREPARWRR